MHSPLDTLHLLRPWWLLLLAAAAAIFWLDRTRRRDEAGWRKIVSPALLAWLMVTSGKAPWIRPGPAAALLLALAAIPLSGPAWRREPSPFVADRAAMMVSLDVSRAAAPTLDAAKRKIRDLVGARGGARTGLVAYAGTAHLVLPAATDAGLIETYLDALLPDVMPRDGRDITAALTTSLRQLDSSDGAGTVVLVTGAIPARDGDAFAGAIAGSRHAVIVLPPAPVPREALSGARGAVIVPSTADQTDIATVMTHAEQHFAAVAQDDPALRWHDEGAWLAVLLVPLALLWARRGFLVVTLVVMTSAAPAHAAGWTWFEHLWLTPDQQGRLDFTAGRFAEAAGEFIDPMWRGAALYRAGDFPGATAAFATVNTAEAWYNRGNAQLMQAAGWNDALASYDQALTLRPGFPQARANRALAAAFVAHQRAMEASREDENAGKPNLKADAVTPDQGPRQEAPATPPAIGSGGGLSDDQITALWMRRVGGTPADFLKLRFARQVEGAAP